MFTFADSPKPCGDVCRLLACKGTKMIRLNLPPYEIKLGGSREHPQIFDTLRRRYVALTPEEWVRQHFTHYLIEHLGYPAPLMANEVQLSVGQKQLRADSVLYDRDLRPRMIIEYKAPMVSITQKVFNQITAYNLLLHAPWLVVSNGLSHYCCKLSEDGEKYVFVDHLPRYEEL